MKIFKIMLIFLMPAIFLFSCGPAVSNVRRFKNYSVLTISDYGFKLTLPINWEAKELWNEPRKKQRRVKIVKATNGNGMSLDIYIRRVHKNFVSMEEWIDKRVRRHIRKLKVGKEKRYSYKTANGKKVIVRYFSGSSGSIALAFFVHNGNYIYTVVKGSVSVDEMTRNVIIPGLKFIG